MKKINLIKRNVTPAAELKKGIKVFVLTNNYR